MFAKAAGPQSTPLATYIQRLLTTRGFAVLLAAVILLLYFPVAIGIQTFSIRDYSIFAYPFATYLKESIWRGEMPLWDPYNNCGIPFLAQWSTISLYPGSLIYILLPLPWSLW